MKGKRKKLLVQVCGFVSWFLTLFLMAGEVLLILYTSMSYFEARKITMDRDLKAIEEKFCEEGDIFNGFHDSHMKDFKYDKIYLLKVKGNGEAEVVLMGINDDEDFIRTSDEKPYVDFDHSLNLKEIVSGKDHETKCEILFKSGKVFDRVCVGLRLLSFEDADTYVLCLIDDMTEFEETMNRMIIPTIGACIVLIILTNILLLGYLYFLSIKPVTLIQRSVWEYTETKDTAKITEELSRIKSQNEFGSLASDISQLAKEIERYTQENIAFAKEKQRASTELEMAARIQLSQLPNKFPYFSDRKEFEVYASMKPAKEIGGDFYDFFLVDSDHLALVIADVAGKGVPAALFMMVTKMLINGYTIFDDTPAGIMRDVNNRLCRSNDEEMFVSVWLGILEISTGKLTSVNAGHEYPAIKRAEGNFELDKYEHNLVAGLVPGQSYSDHEIKLNPGDIIFVYTDGVPEALNKAQEQFGTARLISTIDSLSEKPLCEMLQGVHKAVENFSQDVPQFDDLTMLVLKYNGNEGCL